MLDLGAGCWAVGRLSRGRKEGRTNEGGGETQTLRPRPSLSLPFPPFTLELLPSIQLHSHPPGGLYEVGS